MEFSTEQLKSYHEAFAQFDINNDGTISSGELTIVMRELGFKISAQDVYTLIAEANKNAGDKLTFPEFCALMKKHAEIDGAAQHLRELFKTYDEDDVGFITKEQLKSALKRLGKETSDEEIDMMFFQADLNSDGKVNYHEFAMTWAKKFQ